MFRFKLIKDAQMVFAFIKLFIYFVLYIYLKKLITDKVNIKFLTFITMY